MFKAVIVWWLPTDLIRTLSIKMARLSKLNPNSVWCYF